MNRTDDENPGILRIPEPGEDGYDELAGWVMYLHQLWRPLARIAADGAAWLLLDQRLPIEAAHRLTERVGLDSTSDSGRWVAVVAHQVLGALRGYRWRRTPGVSESPAPVGRDCTLVMADDQRGRTCVPMLADHRLRGYEDLSSLVSWTAEEREAIEAMRDASDALLGAIHRLDDPKLRKVAEWFEWTSGLPRISAAPLLQARGQATRPCRSPIGPVDFDGIDSIDLGGMRDNAEHDRRVREHIGSFWESGTRTHLDAVPLLTRVVADVHLQARALGAADPRAKRGPREIAPLRNAFADQVGAMFDRLAQIAAVVSRRDKRSWTRHVMANRRPFVAEVLELLELPDHRVYLDANGDPRGADWFRRVNRGRDLNPLCAVAAQYVTTTVRAIGGPDGSDQWEARCLAFVDATMAGESPALLVPCSAAE